MQKMDGFTEAKQLTRDISLIVADMRALAKRLSKPQRGAS